MTEYECQKMLFKWSSFPLVRNKYPELKYLFHIKNETPKGGAQQVAVDHAQGVKKGVPDLFLPVARGGYHGLFVEMKAKTGRVSKEQEWWISELNGLGFKAAVCRGFEDARDTIISYLGGGKHEHQCDVQQRK